MLTQRSLNVHSTFTGFVQMRRRAVAQADDGEDAFEYYNRAPVSKIAQTDARNKRAERSNHRTVAPLYSNDSLLDIVLPNGTLPSATPSRKRARAACDGAEGSPSEETTSEVFQTNNLRPCECAAISQRVCRRGPHPLGVLRGHQPAQWCTPPLTDLCK
jgi:hypothetical protein